MESEKENFIKNLRAEAEVHLKTEPAYKSSPAPSAGHPPDDGRVEGASAVPTRPEVKIVERRKLEDGRTFTTEYTLTPEAIVKLQSTRPEERVIEVGKQFYAALCEYLHPIERGTIILDGYDCLVLYSAYDRRLIFKPSKKP